MIVKKKIEIFSVNVGKPRIIEMSEKAISTGIFKYPTSEPVEINKEGIVGDVIANKGYHGGVDQALYFYSQQDYQWWEKELGKTLSPGTFGENLTLSHFPDSPLRIGDRFAVNNLLLEITAPRIPCATLAARMEDVTFVKKFVKAKRPGVYVRVLETGRLQVGDYLDFVPSSKEFPTVIEVFDIWYDKEPNQILLRKALESPIAQRAKPILQQWLNNS
jgi:MOSC domain-containing protein YiiM